MKRATAVCSATIAITQGGWQLAFADDFEVSVQASAEHPIPSQACDDAFLQAEDEALLQLDERFAGQPAAQYATELISSKETRTKEDSRTICVFQGTWKAKALENPSDLIGKELSIKGIYSGSCLDERNGDLCWQRIVRQAREDLFRSLEPQHGNLNSIDLLYTDFEGRQRDEYKNKRLEMTADGRFFFEAVDRDSVQPSSNISIRRKDARVQERPSMPAKPETPTQNQQREKDKIDVTLFYVWDGNDTALSNDLAISSNRWGAGVWANNRIGFVAFQGTDQLGIGDRRENVKNDSGTYKTTGVGMGFRMWDTRGITLENLVYYVDAQPYSATVSPDCDTCTPLSFQSEDYLQATVNLKTNSHGLNVGWMFTWKVLEDQSNIDTLSSGFYVEAQF